MKLSVQIVVVILSSYFIVETAFLHKLSNDFRQKLALKYIITSPSIYQCLFDPGLLIPQELTYIFSKFLR